MAKAHGFAHYGAMWERVRYAINLKTERLRREAFSLKKIQRGLAPCVSRGRGSALRLCARTNPLTRYPRSLPQG